jgi:hypothetical protein
LDTLFILRLRILRRVSVNGKGFLHKQISIYAFRTCRITFLPHVLRYTDRKSG